jgi:hypothetical protein
MSTSNKMIRIDNQYPIVAGVQPNHGKKTYQAQALKLFPWICARGGHEFSGKRLRELTNFSRQGLYGDIEEYRQQLIPITKERVGYRLAPLQSSPKVLPISLPAEPLGVLNRPALYICCYFY